MAATPTIGVRSSTLLLFAMLLLVSNCQCANAKVCPRDCIGNAAAYMTCPNTGSLKLKPVCNCCMADRGCKIYGHDGTEICTAKGQLRPCPLILLPAAYMTCPSSGSLMLRPAANCCVADLGCKLYYKDGTVICTAAETSTPA